MHNPNTSLWQTYHSNSQMRGQLVAHILAEHLSLDGARILDVGCGDGGIAIALAQIGAQVKAIDPDPARIRKLVEGNVPNMETEICTGEALHEPELFYDAVILNDVLEHAENPGLVLFNCRQCLKKDGRMYITTPNKFSLLNIFCDPHYSMPGIALMPRRQVKKIVAQWLKWMPQEKQDFPQLFGLSQLVKILKENNLAWQFVNRGAAQFAFTEPRALWSRKLHLSVVHLIKKFKLEKIFLTLIHDKIGFYNQYMNPTWFIIAGRI